MNILLAIACADVAIWMYLLLARGGFWHAYCEYNIPVIAPVAWPEVTVIIPARNEADILGDTLPSLLANEYPLRVVLVDDRSEDATAMVAADIAARLQASDRLTVISRRALPQGWKGKVSAMQCGIEHVMDSGGSPRYILFTDADIAYDPGALTRLVIRAESRNLVLASLMVRLRCKSIAEHYLIPAFVYFFQMLYPFHWVNQGKRGMAAAAGGCMLLRWDALQQAGGLHSIRDALIDDCALGRLMKGYGNIWLGLTKRVHSLREYPRLHDIRTMVARTAYDQLGYSPFNLAGSLVGMVITYIAPVFLVFFATGAAQFLGVASCAAMALSFIPILRFYSRPLWQCITLPVVALCYMGFTLDSAWQYRRGRGGMWKGRAQATARQAA